MKKVSFLLICLISLSFAYSQIPVEVKYAENKEKGEAFLIKNAKKDNVVALPCGIQYQIVKQGTGAKPKLTDRVKVNYSGTLIDGTKFDSSYDRGEPAIFNVNRVIKGWTEVLQLMPVGSKWIVYIPFDLAYSSLQAGSIPPYSMLIFEIELLSIEPTY